MTSPIRITLSEWIDAPLVEPAPSAVEFAIGDVHGHIDLLDAVLASIRLLASDAGPERAHLTFLGDLIDRGPASVACLRRAFGSPADLGVGGVTRLLGNHEQFMRLFLNGDRRLRLWLQNGADALFHELGHDVATILKTEEREQIVFWGEPPQVAYAKAADVVRTLLRDGLGEATMQGVETMVSHRRSGNLLFVHAGVDPWQTPDEFLASPDHLIPANERHWCWIREPFLRHGQTTFADPSVEGGIIVVHGHTPEPDMPWYSDRRADELHRIAFGRLNLDGGSYRSGVVAAAQIESGRYRTILASRAEPRTRF